MTSPKYTYKATVSSRGAASSYLSQPGDAVIVDRQGLRWLILACPCGCGAEIPINLDGRAGKAWRLFKHKDGALTVYPSVWRDTDCKSHFIIWRSKILLIGPVDHDWRSPQPEVELTALSDAVINRMPQTAFISYLQVADAMGEDPWDVLDACRALVRLRRLKESGGEVRDLFARM
jgi:hypothetical protein